MLKTGRPKSIEPTNNRVHSILFTEKAEIIFRFMNGKMRKGWIHEWISQKLCEEFPIDNEPEFRKQELKRRAKALNEAQKAFYEMKDIIDKEGKKDGRH